MGIIRRLIPALEAQDPATARHAQRVCLYSMRLAGELGFSSRDCLLLRLAARLHDLGKTQLPPGLIDKPGRLTPEERRQMEAHTIYGERLVRGVISDPDVAAAVRGHHERYDGGGYPDGLQGRAIPLLGRILTIADSFDAMTSPRPYRRPVSVVEALGQLAAEAGKQFDPGLVPLFVRGTLSLNR